MRSSSTARFAVVASRLTNFLIPLAVLPIYSAMQNVSPGLLEAGRDLGSGRIEPDAPGGAAAGDARRPRGGRIHVHRGCQPTSLRRPCWAGRPAAWPAAPSSRSSARTLNWPLGAALAMTLIVVLIVVVIAISGGARVAGPMTAAARRRWTAAPPRLAPADAVGDRNFGAAHLRGARARVPVRSRWSWSSSSRSMPRRACACPWPGSRRRWYGSARRPEVRQALTRSVIAAVVTALVAGPLGVLAALGSAALRAARAAVHDGRGAAADRRARAAPGGGAGDLLPAARSQSNYSLPGAAVRATSCWRCPSSS